MNWPRWLNWIYGLNGASPPDPAARLERARRRMIARDLIGRGIADRRVLEAMAAVPREAFVPSHFILQAYDDKPLEIGHEQTISQPYIVAHMTELLAPRPGERILEIGAGCGYQTAILLHLGAEVFAVEILPSLAQALEARLRSLGFERFHVSCHDGRRGWPEHAPYDGVLAAAAPAELPAALFDQTRVGGRIVAPVGTGSAQTLNRWTREEEGWMEERIAPVRFVPMTGEEE